MQHFISHHEAHEGHEGFGYYLIINFVLFVSFVVKFAFPFLLRHRATLIRVHSRPQRQSLSLLVRLPLGEQTCLSV